jgi:hypothetical protein
MIDITNIPFENVKVKKLDIFKGYQLDFQVKEQDFQFLVGKAEQVFPMGVKHNFKKQENCHICNRLILQSPVGQQPCLLLQQNMLRLLRHFQRHFKLEL